MDFWEDRAVQDKCDLADLEAGRVLLSEQGVCERSRECTRNFRMISAIQLSCKLFSYKSLMADFVAERCLRRG